MKSCDRPCILFASFVNTPMHTWRITLSLYLLSPVLFLPPIPHLLPLPHLSPLLTHLSCSPWPSPANLTPPLTFSPSFNTPPPPFFVYLPPPTPHTIKARTGKNEVQLLDNNIYGTQSHKNPESLQRHKGIYAHFNTHTHIHTYTHTHTHTHTHTCSHVTVDLIL